MQAWVFQPPCSYLYSGRRFAARRIARVTLTSWWSSSPGPHRSGQVRIAAEELELLAGRRVGHLRRGIPQTIAVRHRIVHAYFDHDLQILWDAATDDIPKLRPAGSRHPHYRVCRFWTRLNGNRAGHGVTHPRQVQSPRDGSLGRTPGRGSDPECSISL
jgi:Protein of unknown function DUF86